MVGIEMVRFMSFETVAFGSFLRYTVHCGRLLLLLGTLGGVVASCTIRLFRRDFFLGLEVRSLLVSYLFFLLSLSLSLYQLLHFLLSSGFVHDTLTSLRFIPCLGGAQWWKEYFVLRGAVYVYACLRSSFERVF